MYNLLDYSKNYSKTPGSLWNYYREELTYDGNDNNGPNNNVINSKSFKYKASITGSTYNVNDDIINCDPDMSGKIKDFEIAVPLKYLSNFWRTLDIPVINCEVSLTLTWPVNCVINSLEKRLVTAAQGDIPAVYDNSPIGALFDITDTKLYVPVITLSDENDNKLLEQLNTGFKSAIKWNKYRSEMSNQAQNNNLNYLIRSTFTNVNRLFVLSFKNEHGNDDENESVRISFKKYYVPKVEVKDFNILIDGKPSFEIPVQNKKKAYEVIIEMSKTNDYRTGNLLDYEYFSNHYKLIAIDLS